jgi:vacuolar-type H+-ATPase subunit F/Vma7
VKISAIGDPFTVQALRLMGIAGVAVTTPEEASRALDDALAPSTVVLVAESVARMVREKVDALKIARQDFIVLEIPSGEGVPHQAEDTARLVSQAIGVKI